MTTDSSDDEDSEKQPLTESIDGEETSDENDELAAGGWQKAVLSIMSSSDEDADNEDPSAFGAVGWQQIAGTIVVFILVAIMWCYDFEDGDLSALLRNGGGAAKNSQGPWPECLWMTGMECAKFIHGQVPKDVEIEFMHKHAMDEMVSAFNFNRVIIVVNDYDAVQEVPARG